MRFFEDRGFMEHGERGGPPTTTHVASAEVAQPHDEVVRSKRQRVDHPEPLRAADARPLVFEQGVWFRRSNPAADSLE